MSGMMRHASLHDAILVTRAESRSNQLRRYPRCRLAKARMNMHGASRHLCGRHKRMCSALSNTKERHRALFALRCVVNKRPSGSVVRDDLYISRKLISYDQGPDAFTPTIDVVSNSIRQSHTGKCLMRPPIVFIAFN